MPRNPNPDESRNDYASFCIKWMIDHKEYPNTKEGRNQAAGHCYSIYDTYKKENSEGGGSIREYIKMSFPLIQKIQVRESDGFELDSCVMLLTDTITRNRTYFPHDEVEKAIEYWKGVPINLNHERDDVRSIVGHLDDVKLDGNKLMCKPMFDSETKEYDTAMGYIKSRFNAGGYPNVSTGLWADGTTETVGDEEEVRVLRNHNPDHLALVVHGSCDPALGCGIGLSKDETIPIQNQKYDCECIECGHKMTSDKHCKDIKCSECGGTMRRVERPGPGQENKPVTIPHEDYVEKNEEYEDLKKEILDEKIKKEEAKNE